MDECCDRRIISKVMVVCSPKHVLKHFTALSPQQFADKWNLYFLKTAHLTFSPFIVVLNVEKARFCDHLIFCYFHMAADCSSVHDDAFQAVLLFSS